MDESAAAQYYRDARVLPIYEGTNGIQASDFVFRKIARDKAALATTYIEEMDGLVDNAYLEQLKEASSKIVSMNNDKLRDDIAWIATPYLKGFAYILGGALLAKAAKANPEFELQSGYSIQDLSDFYAKNVMPLGGAQLAAV